jgi:hypothetical protein
MIDVNCANAALTGVFRPPIDLLPQQSPALASRSSSVNAFRSEHRQLPGVGSFVVADEIRVAVRASQFEVPAVGRQPRVEQFRNGNAPVTQDQRAWRLLAAVACIAFDANADRLSVSDRIIAKR